MSYGPRMKDSWKFVVESIPSINGRRIKSLRPDANGYYRLPLMAVGLPARSGIIYTPEPLIDCIKTPTSRFNIMLTDGNLYGHADHPEARTKEDIPKLLDINNKDKSHHIKKIWTEEDSVGGVPLIMGLIKPCGPWGKYLEEDLQDPDTNTSFSIRSLCKERTDMTTRTVYRDIQILVTFDWVTAPGFKEASSRYAPAQESFAIDITPEDFIDANGKLVACESISDKELLNVFGIMDTVIGDKKGIYQKGRNSFIDATDGNKHSIFHALLGNTGR